MHTLKRIGHFLLVIVAILVIVLSASGIYGTWWLHSTLTDVTLRVFSAINTGVAVVDNGVGLVGGLVQDGRTEVQQAEQTITAVGGNLQENSPVLTALNTRLETRLAPAVSRIQTTLAPVRGALQTISTVVGILNSIPFIQENAPAVDRVDTALSRVDLLAADVRQLDDTLRASVVEGKNQLTQEAVATLTTLTTRIDTGLSEVQTVITGVQSDIADLQARLDARQARLLRIYNLAAIALTLLMLWLIYSQIVVIQKHWRGFRAKGSGEADSAPALAIAAPEAVDAIPAEPSQPA
jgi:uncharacterized phage infection (PIP) family protein YhgE